jgi:hypothetical protein
MPFGGLARAICAGNLIRYRLKATFSRSKDKVVTDLLEKALAEVQKLPEAEQDAIAAVILDALADEQRWNEAFARSQEQLGRLADRVREGIRAGRVTDVITMSAEEHVSFWNALNQTPKLTSAQRRLGAVMRGES